MKGFYFNTKKSLKTEELGFTSTSSFLFHYKLLADVNKSNQYCKFDALFTLLKTKQYDSLYNSADIVVPFPNYFCRMSNAILSINALS